MESYSQTNWQVFGRVMTWDVVETMKEKNSQDMRSEQNLEAMESVISQSFYYFVLHHEASIDVLVGSPQSLFVARLLMDYLGYSDRPGRILADGSVRYIKYIKD